MKLNESKLDKSTVRLNSKNILIPNETVIDDMIYLGRVLDKGKERFIFRCQLCSSIKVVSKHTIIQREHLWRPFSHSYFGKERVPKKLCQIHKQNKINSLSREFLIDGQDDESEARVLKVIFNKAGGTASKSSYTTKLSLPMKFLKDMGVTPDEREVEAIFDGEKIVIQKKSK